MHNPRGWNFSLERRPLHLDQTSGQNDITAVDA